MSLALLALAGPAAAEGSSVTTPPTLTAGDFGGGGTGLSGVLAPLEGKAISKQCTHGYGGGGWGEAYVQDGRPYIRVAGRYSSSYGWTWSPWFQGGLASVDVPMGTARVNAAAELTVTGIRVTYEDSVPRSGSCVASWPHS